MPRGEIVIGLGRNSKDYIEVIGNLAEYKRSGVKISGKGKEIRAVVEAKDSKALLSAMMGLLKRLTVANNVDEMLSRQSGKV